MISWNCQGIKSRPTVRRLKGLRAQYRPDVIFLMETKNNEEVVLEKFKDTDYCNHFIVPPLRRGGGLALMWKSNVSIQILSSSPNLIDTSIKFKTHVSKVSFIYGPPVVENRAAFWSTLETLFETRNDAWMLTGDFNELLNREEKRGGVERNESSYVDFRTCVSKLGLLNVKHSGNPLSWRGNRSTFHVKCRLDRSLANCSWFEKFPTGRCQYLKFEGSDHRPLVSFFGKQKEKVAGLFRYDRTLGKNVEVKALVKDSWITVNSETVARKLDKCRSKIIQWTKDNKTNNKVLIREAQEALDRALAADVEDPVLISSITSKLNLAYTEEEDYWSQRSRVNWLQCGDRNTAFFHATTCGRRAFNELSVLENEEGQAFYEEEEITQLICNFYKNLFTSKPSNHHQIVNEVLSPRITQEDNDVLIRIPDEQEIKDATFAINGDRAPGPDGFSAAFYHSFWEFISKDVVKEVQNFFESNNLHARHNETHIRLIPKTLVPKRVTDYRLIALCSTHYKIIAKIITKRLQPLLPSLVSPHQSAFVPKRAISDNVLITHEILYYLQSSMATSRCAMAVKTDMSKAYDRIEWGFLKAVLTRLGFHATWIQWLMVCVRTVTYSFLINGTSKGQFIPSRGLRQGDPLSPYLFILCTEVLSGLCKKGQEDGSLPGIKVANNCPPINHLLFADDTMFFTKTGPKRCKALMSILKRYEEASGQVINLAKSTITFLSKAPLHIKRRVQRSLKIRNEGGLGKYLGLLEHFGRQKKDIFMSILDKIQQKTVSWTTRFLSSAGKMVLLKAVLSAMPAYSMSCFKLPISLNEKIQSALTRFWWDDKPGVQKISWVAWNRLCLPNDMGGLGFRDIEAFNISLLAKVAWRIHEYPNSLLGQILLGKYCGNTSFLECTLPRLSSYGWKGIMAGREVLKKGLGWIVGDGAKINVWNSPWLSHSTPSAPFGPPNLNQLELMVSDFINQDTRSWNLDMIRQHLPHYEGTIQQIFLSSFTQQDSLVWLPDKTGSYSTKTGYNHSRKLCTTIVDGFDWWRDIWSVKTPPKIQTFLWKMKVSALPIGNNLAIRGIICDVRCKRCGVHEDELHILVNCPYARRVWELVPALSTPILASYDSLLTLFESARNIINLPPSGIVVTLFPWVCWHLWKSRNCLTFENRFISESEVVMKIIVEARCWQAANVVPKPFSSVNVGTRPYQRDDETTTCNVDATWDERSLACGLGWIYTTESGETLFQGAASRRFVSSALMAEALAVKAALCAASHFKIRKLMVLSDSHSLVTLLLSGGVLNELKSILFDIRCLINSSSYPISFMYVPRLDNQVADSIAKSALRGID